LLQLPGINADDFGVGNFGDDDGKVSGALGHLQLDVIAVVRRPVLSQELWVWMPGAINLLLAGEIISMSFMLPRRA